MSRCVRSLFVTTAALALAVVLWPSDAQAQSRGQAGARTTGQSRPRPPSAPTTGRAVARPGYNYPSRPIYPGYGYGYRYGYGYPYYGYPYYGYGYYPYYYSPYYYGSFYFGLGYGAPYAWYGYPGYGYPGYGYYGQYPYPPYAGHYDDSASLRLQVKPTNAEVYLDGQYVGLVDSYDGMFQRLYVAPGDHVVEVFFDGHRTVRESMRFVPRESYELKRVMEPLADGEAPPVRPKPDPSAVRVNERSGYPQDTYERRPPPRARIDEPPPQGQVRPGRPDDVQAADAGAVAIRVQPGGAVILIDGEKWEGPNGPERLVVHLSEGTHKIEIQKEGYRPFVTEVRIRRGETVPLNISLRTAG